LFLFHFTSSWAAAFPPGAGSDLAHARGSVVVASEHPGLARVPALGAVSHIAEPAVERLGDRVVFLPR
jgi:hypothetical protein